jgi:hypothetical protein
MEEGVPQEERDWLTRLLTARAALTRAQQMRLDQWAVDHNFDEVSWPEWTTIIGRRPGTQ